MGRQKNDGRGRLGGRTKGKTNNLPGNIKADIATGLTDRLTTYFDKLDAIEDPIDYCAAYTSMAKAILPKDSSITIENQKTIEDELRELCQTS